MKFSLKFFSFFSLTRARFETEGAGIILQDWPKVIPNLIPTEEPLIVDIGREKHTTINI